MRQIIKNDKMNSLNIYLLILLNQSYLMFGILKTEKHKNKEKHIWKSRITIIDHEHDKQWNKHVSSTIISRILPHSHASHGLSFDTIDATITHSHVYSIKAAGVEFY